MVKRKGLKVEKKALAVFRSNGGILRSSDAIKKGIHPRTLYALRDAGLIEQVQKGLFCLPGLPGHTQPDLVIAARKVPTAVICLISALFFHRLTTQIPHYIYLAVRQGYKPPKIDHPPTQFYWFSNSTFDLGVEVHELEGVKVRCYSKEKTIVDCFKFRNKVGIDVAIEALKKYWQQGKPRLDLLMRFAKIARIEKIIKPYIEVVINESS
jgi:predicted transcriptional regulator of viral defense system